MSWFVSPRSPYVHVVADESRDLIDFERLMNAALKSLESCLSQGSLKSALNAICVRFGTVIRVDVLSTTHIAKPQALCFVRMQTPAQEQALMRELGVGCFGGDVVIVVNLSDRWTSSSFPFTSTPLQSPAAQWAHRS